MILAAALLATLSLAVVASDVAVPNDSVVEIDRLYFQRHHGRNLEVTIELLEAARAKTPEDPALEWRLGRSLIRLGERKTTRTEKLAMFERSEAVLRKAVALKPENPEGHFWLGIAMGRRGQTRGILNSLFLVAPLRREMEAVLKHDPKHGGAHHVLGEMLMELPRLAGGSRKGAVRELETAVGLDPDHAAHYIPLAQAYLALGEREKAAAVLGQVAQIKKPADPAEYEDDLLHAREMLKKIESKR